MRVKAWPSGMTGGGSSRGPAECRSTSSAKTLSCPCEPHLKSRFPAVLPPPGGEYPAVIIKHVVFVSLVSNTTFLCN